MHNAAKLSEVNVNNYNAVFIPGGLAPMVDMPENAELKKVIAEVYERNAVVGAVCHGPVSLLNVKLSDGTYLVDGKISLLSPLKKKKKTTMQERMFLLTCRLH